jgi:DNA-directed RNA polymerase specialized sigma24 family protein
MNLSNALLEPTDAEAPPHKWKDSLLVDDVFSVMLRHGKDQIGKKTLNRVLAFKGFVDEDDILSEALMKLWKRLLTSPINGVAELSADKQTVYFDQFELLFCYTRRIAKNIISNLHRNRDRSSFENSQVPVDSIEIPMPTKSERDQFRLRLPDEWLQCAQDFTTPDQREVLLLKLDGKGDREIASKLGKSLSSARNDRIRLGESFRSNFETPRGLLKAMQSADID